MPRTQSSKSSASRPVDPLPEQALIKNPLLNQWIQTYGDLIFDLAVTVLGHSALGQVAYRSILKKLKDQTQKFTTYERGWVLRVVCEQLILLSQRHPVKTSTSEPNDTAERLKQLQSYFHRLRAEDQLLLLLKDKYQISYSEISTALNIPEGSLKIKRSQALRTLESWLWAERSKR